MCYCWLSVEIRCWHRICWDRFWVPPPDIPLLFSLLLSSPFLLLLQQYLVPKHWIWSRLLEPFWVNGIQEHVNMLAYITIYARWRHPSKLMQCLWRLMLQHPNKVLKRKVFELKAWAPKQLNRLWNKLHEKPPTAKSTWTWKKRKTKVWLKRKPTITITCRGKACKSAATFRKQFHPELAAPPPPPTCCNSESTTSKATCFGEPTTASSSSVATNLISSERVSTGKNLQQLVWSLRSSPWRFEALNLYDNQTLSFGMFVWQI